MHSLAFNSVHTNEGKRENFPPEADELHGVTPSQTEGVFEGSCEESDK